MNIRCVSMRRLNDNNNQSKAVVIIVIVVAALWVTAIIGYGTRKVLWLSNNKQEFDALIDDIRIMSAFPIGRIHYQDGDISTTNLGCDYQTGEHYIYINSYDSSDKVSKEKATIDYDEYKKTEEEAERKITDDINRIKNRVWTGDKHFLSCINAYWDRNGKLLVYILVAQKELRNTEKVMAYSYVYIEDGFSDRSVEPSGRLKKLKENWYLEEDKTDVG